MSPAVDAGAWSLLPPLVAVGLALLTRRVAASLLAGIVCGGIVLSGGNPAAGLAAAVAEVVGVLAEAGQARVVVFTLLMGALLEVTRRSGGVDGFVAWASRWSWARSPRGAQLAAAALGLGVFIESTITCLVVGAVGRPLFDRLGLSRARLAYVCDATSAPVCMLIPLNGWGAMVLGLLATEAAAGHLGGHSPFGVFVRAVPFNLYSLAAVALVFVVAGTRFNLGPMAGADRAARPADGGAGGGGPGGGAGPAGLVVPMVVLTGVVVAGIVATGREGVRMDGLEDFGWMEVLARASGSTSVLWGVLAALAASALLALPRGRRIPGGWLSAAEAGAGGILPMAVLMVLAFAIGSTCSRLGTGAWLAGAARPWMSAGWLPAGMFLIAAAISFATGTSWGTFAILMPLAVPLAADLGNGEISRVALAVGAVLAGGVFGDHCSPISDTTLVSSMAAGCDHAEHVRTQLPFALLGGAIALAGYAVLGFVV